MLRGHRRVSRMVGAEELKRDFPKAAPAVKKHLREEFGIEKDEVARFFDGLSKDGDPSAYVFCCLRRVSLTSMRLS